MNANIIECLTNIDDMIAKEYPEYLYEGCLPEDADEMDYVTITLKGVQIA